MSSVSTRTLAIVPTTASSCPPNTSTASRTEPARPGVMREASASSLASSKLEDATPIVAAEVGRYSLRVHLDVLEQVSRVVDIRKRLDGEPRFENLDEIRQAKNAMRIELD